MAEIPDWASPTIWNGAHFCCPRRGALVLVENDKTFDSDNTFSSAARHTTPFGHVRFISTRARRPLDISALTHKVCCTCSKLAAKKISDVWTDLGHRIVWRCRLHKNNILRWRKWLPMLWWTSASWMKALSLSVRSSRLKLMPTVFVFPRRQGIIWVNFWSAGDEKGLMQFYARAFYLTFLFCLLV